MLNLGWILGNHEKVTFFLCTLLILLMFVFTGCSSNSEPATIANPIMDTKTIGPTATVDTIPMVLSLMRTNLV